MRMTALSTINFSLTLSLCVFLYCMSPSILLCSYVLRFTLYFSPSLYVSFFLSPFLYPSLSLYSSLSSLSLFLSLSSSSFFLLLPLSIYSVFLSFLFLSLSNKKRGAVFKSSDIFHWSKHALDRYVESSHRPRAAWAERGGCSDSFAPWPWCRPGGPGEGCP